MNKTLKHAMYYQKPTFLSSMRGTKSQREGVSLDRWSSNFSTIKKNITCRPVSFSSYSNELLIINCLNSPLGLKKDGISEDKSYTGGNNLRSLQSNAQTSKLYNDVNESNRVYYDKFGDTLENNEFFVETDKSHLSSFSEKNKTQQFKSETNRTSDIVEEYSEILSKNSKIKKSTNQSGFTSNKNQSAQNSQNFSSYTNFDANFAFTVSSKNIPSKDNRSSRNKRSNEKKYLSSNSILTHTQAAIHNYIEKLSRTFEKNETNFNRYQNQSHQEFESLRNFKFYFKENNFEIVSKNFK